MQNCQGRAALSDFFKCGLEFNRMVKKHLRQGKSYKARRAYSRKKGKRGSRKGAKGAKGAKGIEVPKNAFRQPLKFAQNKELCYIIQQFNECEKKVHADHGCGGAELGQHMTIVKDTMIETLGVDCSLIPPAPQPPGGVTIGGVTTGVVPTGVGPPVYTYPGIPGGTILPHDFTIKTFTGSMINCRYMEMVRRFAYCAVAFFAEVEGRQLRDNDPEVCKYVRPRVFHMGETNGPSWVVHGQEQYATTILPGAAWFHETRFHFLCLAF